MVSDRWAGVCDDNWEFVDRMAIGQGKKKNKTKKKKEKRKNASRNSRLDSEHPKGEISHGKSLFNTT